MKNGVDEETKKRIAEEVDKGNVDPLGLGINPAEIMSNLSSGHIGAVLPQLRRLHSKMGEALQAYDKSSSDNSSEGGK